ncbi:MAG TPA: hypothetical protein VEC17_03470 [Candidatus Binatia bacterium]|nr:hypothetical protein [Candidatus Binatia bacterium]
MLPSQGQGFFICNFLSYYAIIFLKFPGKTETKNQMKKRKILIIFGISVLILASLVLYKQESIKDFGEVKRFYGTLQKVENNTVTATGFFEDPNVKAEATSSSQEVSFSFRVDDSTQIWKREIILPAIDLTKPGQSLSFNLQDRPKTEGAGSFDDLRKLSESVSGINIQVYYSVGWGTPVADSVLYQALIQPPPIR